MRRMPYDQDPGTLGNAGVLVVLGTGSHKPLGKPSSTWGNAFKITACILVEQ